MDGYSALLVVTFLVVGLAVTMLVLNLLLGPKNPSAIKSEPFECGQVQITSPRQRFSVKFYLIAIVFIVFDIEVVFLIPWAVLYRWFLTQPSWAVLAFTEMLVFLGILGLGLAYFWKRRGLEWD